MHQHSDWYCARKSTLILHPVRKSRRYHYRCRGEAGDIQGEAQLLERCNSVCSELIGWKLRLLIQPAKQERESYTFCIMYSKYANTWMRSENHAVQRKRHYSTNWLLLAQWSISRLRLLTKHCTEGLIFRAHSKALRHLSSR